MNDTFGAKELTYKGFYGTYDFDEGGSLFTGEVMGVRAVISFQGRTPAEIEQSFHDSIDLFLNMLYEDEAQKPGANDGVINQPQDSNEVVAESENMQMVKIQFPTEKLKEIQFFAEKKAETIQEFIIRQINQAINQLQISGRVQKELAEWEFPKLIEVTPLPNYSLKIKFEDGLEGTYDLEPSIRRGGVFSALSNIPIFNRVSISVKGNYIFWPDDIEIDARSIYWVVINEGDEWQK